MEEKLKKLQKRIPAYAKDNVQEEEFSYDSGLSSCPWQCDEYSRPGKSSYQSLRRGKSLERMKNFLAEKGLLRRSEPAVEESSSSTDYEDEA